MERVNSAFITTIIPTYKRPARLQNAIISVLNQTFPHFEVWVFDNSSNDDTEKIVLDLREKDSRVNYYKHPSNIGAVANFNFGLKHVTTPFFSFLSDDDVLLPKFYESALKGFEKYPQASFVAGSVIMSNEKGKVIHVATELWPEQEYFHPPHGLWEMIPKHLDWMGILFRKELRDLIGEIDFRVKAIDVDFLYRTSSVVSFAVIKEPWGIFYQHPKSYSFHSSLKVIWPSWVKIIQNVKQKLSPELWPQFHRVMNVTFKKKVFLVFVHNLKLGNFPAAKKSAILIRHYFNSRALSLAMILVVQCMQRIPMSRKFLFAALWIKNRCTKSKKNLQKKFSKIYL